MKTLGEQYFLFSLLERFWSSSGDFWQNGWNNLLDVIGEKSLIDDWAVEKKNSEFMIFRG